jgi:serine/threonine-protein kinase PknG
VAAGGVGEPARRLGLFEHALRQHPQSVELQLRRVDELVTLARYADAESALAEVQRSHPDDWRLAWYRGRCLLAQGKTQETLKAFEDILSEMPGELAPKQAVARAYEASGELDRAAGYYDAVSRADASFTSAAFGLARCLERKGDRAGAAEAYRRVPASSSRYAQAQMALARALLAEAPGAAGKTLQDLLQASEAVQAASEQLDGLEVHKLRAELFVEAARFVEGGGAAAAKSARNEHVLRCPMRPKPLRRRAEEELRSCARMAGSEPERIRWVDEANRVRPVTWL